MRLDVKNVEKGSSTTQYQWTVKQIAAEDLEGKVSSVSYRVSWAPDGAPTFAEGDEVSLTFRVDGVVEEFSGTVTASSPNTCVVRTESVTVNQ